MKQIILTQGQYALVDDDDFVTLSQYKWHAHKNPIAFYATRWSSQKTGKRKLIRMHNVIMKVPDGYEVDHIDGNTLNNCRENLRITTHRQNCFNRKKTNKTSKYMGVSWNKNSQNWQANIYENGSIRYLGHFSNEQEAFLAYSNALNNIGEKMAGCSLGG
jgi:hypothetical protein